MTLTLNYMPVRDRVGNFFALREGGGGGGGAQLSGQEKKARELLDLSLRFCDDQSCQINDAVIGFNPTPSPWHLLLVLEVEGVGRNLGVDGGENLQWVRCEVRCGV